HHPAIAAHAARPPGCTDSCCQTHPSTSSSSPLPLTCTRCRYLFERSQNRPQPLPHVFQAAALCFGYQVGVASGSLFLFLGSWSRQSLREQDRLQRVDRFFQAVVNQNIVVFVVILNLTRGRDQPALDHLFRIQAAGAQPLLQFPAIRGHDEDAYGVSNSAFDLRCTLDIDVKQEVLSFLVGQGQKPARGAIVVAIELGMFEKFIFADHFFKFGRRHEEVLPSVLLAGARRPGGVRDGEFQTRHNLAHLIYQRRLARTGWRRNDVDATHSMFCTCSRAFSISVLIASPISVIFSASPARPEVFESNVLASRFISCKRKSSFLPTSPSCSSNPRKCFTWVSNRTSSSWISLRSTSSAASCSRRSGSTWLPINSCIRVFNLST